MKRILEVFSGETKESKVVKGLHPELPAEHCTSKSAKLC